MQFDRRKEKRHPCSLMVEIFLSREKDEDAITPFFQALLCSLSRIGAEIALDEIMHDRTHLALDPMGSDKLQFNIILPIDSEDQSLTVSAKPVWFNKKKDTGLPPFRIGLQFTKTLSAKQLQRINRRTR